MMANIKTLLPAILLACLFNTDSRADNDPFQMCITPNSVCIQINRNITTLDSIDFSSIDYSVQGLAITGRVVQPDADSYALVVARDVNGKHHLVMESCRMFHDVDTFAFENYAEDSKYIHGVQLDKVFVRLRNAELRLDNVTMNLEAAKKNKRSGSRTSDDEEMQDRIACAEIKVERINADNELNARPWVADVTSVCLMDFDDKCRALGLNSSHIATDTEDNEEIISPLWLEYYYDGYYVFEGLGVVPGLRCGSQSPKKNSSFAPSFDWRNRHGKNWITPAKNQQTGWGCWAFASVACIEAMTNLYFNRQINLDLAEQEMISYYTQGSLEDGGNAKNALSAMANVGISEEEAFPFVNQQVSYSLKSPNHNELIQYGGVQYISQNSVDSVKRSLIQHGPLVSGYQHVVSSTKRHTMLLVGYKTIQAGDTLHCSNTRGYQRNIIFSSDNPRIGQTVWIFKNNYGDSYYGANQGYAQMIVPINNQELVYPCYILPSISSLNYTDNDILCEDADGDGYYNWGIGPKPAHAPAWIPDEPDGDDSDPSKGPMDEYGYLLDFDSQSADTLYLTTTTVWDSAFSLKRPVVVEDSVLLSVRDTVNMCGNSVIILRKGAEISVNGGNLRNALIRPEGNAASMVRVINGGVIRTRKNEETKISSLQNLYMNDGEIY